MQTLGVRAYADQQIELSKANPLSQATTSQASTCPTCGGARFVKSKSIRFVEGGKEAIPAEIIPCPACTNPPQKEDYIKGIVNPKTFAGFVPHPAMIEAFAAVLDVVNGVRPLAFLLGSWGIGKSHLAQGAADRWAESFRTVVYVSVPEFLAKLKTTFDPEEQARYEPTFEGFASAPLLILDDLGAQYATPWAKGELFRVIDRRYTTKMPLIVTSNCPLRDLDPRVSSRLSPGKVEIRGVPDRRDEFE